MGDEIITHGQPDVQGHVLALCRVPERGEWTITLFETTAFAQGRAIRRFPLAERDAAMLEYYDYQTAHYRGELMSAAASCPECGEAWTARLVWGDDGFLHCKTCGAAFLPYTGERKEARHG